MVLNLLSILEVVEIFWVNMFFIRKSLQENWGSVKKVIVFFKRGILPFIQDFCFLDDTWGHFAPHAP